MAESASPVIPKRITVFEGPDKTILQIRWYRHSAWIFLLFGLLWTGWVSLNYWKDGGGFHLVAVIFGAFWTYHVITSLTNKTDIAASSASLKLRTHPLPWFPHSKVDVSTLHSFSTHVRQGRYGPSYKVISHDFQGREKVLLSSLPEEEATYLRDSLNTFYHLPPQP